MKKLLTDMNACTEAIEWVGDRDLQKAWEECERGDWMLWLAGRSGINLRTLTLVKARCANYADADAAAKRKALKQCAEICREVIPFEVIESAVNKTEE